MAKKGHSSESYCNASISVPHSLAQSEQDVETGPARARNQAQQRFRKRMECRAQIPEMLQQRMRNSQGEDHHPAPT